jgi:hypothetical protein
MKNIIFFFVNPDQLISLSKGTIDRTNLPTKTAYKLISPNGIITYFVGTNALKIDELNDRCVFVMSDDSSVKTTLDKISSLSGKEASVFAVFHKSVNNSGLLADFFLKSLNDKFKTYLTESEIIGSTYEKFLLPLIKAFSDQVFDNLLKVFPDFVLEAKLSLLHNCLVPSGTPDELPEVLSGLAEGSEYRKAFEIFRTTAGKKKDENLFDPDFVDALTKFRKVLLGS